MAASNRILTRKMIADICTAYGIKNETQFTINLISYLIFVKDGVYTADPGFKYRIYFYRNILNIQYNKTKNIWEKMIYLFFKKAAANLDFSDIRIFTNPVSSTTQRLQVLIDTIELVINKYQDTSIQNVQEFPTVFTVTRDMMNDTYINGEKLVNGSVRQTLYKLSACAVKTISANSSLFNVVVDDVVDDSAPPTNGVDVGVLETDLRNLQMFVSTLNNRLDSLSNGILMNNDGDLAQAGAIQSLQLTKVDKSTTINGKSLSSNITLTLADIGGAGNIDTTSDLAKPISIATQNALNLKADKSVTINGQDLSGNVILRKEDLGLGNVDNTSDLNKPISTAMQNALNLKSNANITINGKNLNSNIELNSSDIGLGNVNNTADLAKPISTATQLSLDFKVDKSATINGQSLFSDVVLNKNDIGLGNVDNTSDLAKPISTATQLSLNNKVDTSLTINGKTLSANILLTKADIDLDNVDNTSDLNKPISNDVQDALDNKVSSSITINNYPLTSNVTLTKNDISLGNVDNTSDLNKPLSSVAAFKFSIVENGIDVLSDLVDTKVDNFTTINNIPLNRNITLTKNDIELNNVDNTADIDKPLSTAMINALSLKQDVSEKNIPDGYVGLDSSGVIPLSVMPPIIGSSLSYLGTWNAASNTPTILSGVGVNGQYYKVSVAGASTINGISSWSIGDWIIYNGNAWQNVPNSDQVNSVNSRTGNVVITKSDVGLSNVNNTSDLNKPLSTAAQSALNLKLSKVLNSNNGNLPIFNNDELVDSNIFIDDLSSSANILWTSNKVTSYIYENTRTDLPDFYFNTFSQTAIRNYYKYMSSASLVKTSTNQLNMNYVVNTPVLGEFAGSVYSPFENRVYFVPHTISTSLYYINVDTLTVGSTSISNLQQYAYIGGAYSPFENRIYFSPYNQSGILHYVDCNTGTVVEYNYNKPTEKFFGAVFSPKENRIYFIPNTTTNKCTFVNCSTSTISTFNHLVSILNDAYRGGVYSPSENRIYLVPFAQNNNWCYIDCSTNSLIEFISGNSNNNGYCGGVYSPTDNFIYMIPNELNNTIAYIDCNDGSVSSFTFMQNNKFVGGTFAYNRIYMIPDKLSPISYINLTTQSVETVGGSTHGGFGCSYVGNYIFLCPNTNQTDLQYIKFLDGNVSKTLLSGALFNKL